MLLAQISQIDTLLIILRTQELVAVSQQLSWCDASHLHPYRHLRPPDFGVSDHRFAQVTAYSLLFSMLAQETRTGRLD